MSSLTRVPSAQPRTPRAERSRQRILDAAGQCFAQSGYAKTTVEQVASRAAVSKGLVYHHFGNKEQILDDVVERTLVEWEAVSQVETIASGGSVLEGIASMHRASTAYARSNPALRALIDLDSGFLLNARAGQAVRDSMSRLRSALIDAVQVGIASEELRGDLPLPHTADVILVHHLAVIQHTLDPEWVEISEELIEVGIDVLLRGLARSPE